jgi:hypothetical protein
MRVNKSLSMILVFVIIGFHLFLLSQIYFFPYPELFIYPYLTAKGLLPYKQIFDQHFPGLMFFPVNLHSLGMTSVVAARVWHFVAIALTHVFIYLVSRKILKLDKWATAPNVLYFLWQPFLEGYVLWIDTFMPLVLLPAYYFFAKANLIKLRYYFLSGLFLGIALVFKQVVAPMIVVLFLYILFKNKKLKILTLLSAGVLIPAILMLSYFVSIGVWNDFYFWTTTFNLTTFAQMGRKLPDLGSGIKSVFVFLPVILFCLSRLFIKKNDKITTSLTIFFTMSLLFAYARFDFVHLQPALVFGVLISAIYLKSLNNKKLLLTLASGYLLMSAYFLAPFYRSAKSDKVFFFGSHERKLADAVLSYTNQNDKVFAFATTPHIYFLTNTLPPGSVFVFQFPWFMVEAEDEILAGIISDPPKVVVKDPGATVQGMNLVEYMPRINGYFEKNYDIVDKIDKVEILIPK